MRALLRLWFFVLSHLVEPGDSASQAVAVGEPLTTDVERLLGPEHSDTLLAWDRLAVAYRAVGRNAEAIPLLEQTLTSRQLPCGDLHCVWGCVADLCECQQARLGWPGLLR
jgi:hypothetical protein